MSGLQLALMVVAILVSVPGALNALAQLYDRLTKPRAKPVLPLTSASYGVWTVRIFNGIAVVALAVIIGLWIFPPSSNSAPSASSPSGDATTTAPSSTAFDFISTPQFEPSGGGAYVRAQALRSLNNVQIVLDIFERQDFSKPWSKPYVCKFSDSLNGPVKGQEVFFQFVAIDRTDDPLRARSWWGTKSFNCGNSDLILGRTYLTKVRLIGPADTEQTLPNVIVAKSLHAGMQNFPWLILVQPQDFTP